MITSNYTSYPIPQLLLDVIALQEQLREEELLPYGDLLGLYFNIEPINARYHNNPIDYIPFATTGMDGISFGFLTDFGQVSSLDEAYIVRTSPMEFDQPVHIVARNLQDFLNLHYTDFDTLFNLNITSTSEDFERLKISQMNQAKPDESYFEKHNSIRARYDAVINFEPISSIADYFLAVKQSRLLSIVLPTTDNIGVVPFTVQDKSKPLSSKTSITHPATGTALISINYDTQISLAEAKQYVSTASTLAKLAFIREVTSYSLIHSSVEWFSFIEETLLALELHQEASRLYFPEHTFSSHYTPKAHTSIVWFSE